jgi:hypothetical protein
MSALVLLKDIGEFLAGLILAGMLAFLLAGILLILFYLRARCDKNLAEKKERKA